MEGLAFDHSVSAGVHGGHLVVTDSVGIAVGSSACVASDARTADCGPATDIALVEFALGPGNDGLGVPDDFPIDVSPGGRRGQRHPQRRRRRR
jgi:hypothetical protein